MDVNVVALVILTLAWWSTGQEILCDHPACTCEYNFPELAGLSSVSGFVYGSRYFAICSCAPKNIKMLVLKNPPLLPANISVNLDVLSITDCEEVQVEAVPENQVAGRKVIDRITMKNINTLTIKPGASLWAKSVSIRNVHLIPELPSGAWRSLTSEPAEMDLSLSNVSITNMLDGSMAPLNVQSTCILDDLRVQHVASGAINVTFINKRRQALLMENSVFNDVASDGFTVVMPRARFVRSTFRNVQSYGINVLVDRFVLLESSVYALGDKALSVESWINRGDCNK